MLLQIAIINSLPSADYICKQFGPRSDPTKQQAWSGFKLFGMLEKIIRAANKKQITQEI